MKRLFFSFLLLLFSTMVFAQSMQLHDAIAIALKNSLDIQVVKNNLLINEINNNIGIAGGLPLVTGTGSDNEQLTNINQSLNTDRKMCVTVLHQTMLLRVLPAEYNYTMV